MPAMRTLTRLAFLPALGLASPALAAEPAWSELAAEDVVTIITRNEDGSARETKVWIVEVDGKGKYLYSVKFDRIAPKVEGELTINEKIEVSDPRAGKQTIVQSQKAKHLLETAK